jgi:hypothetical protein
VIAVGYLMTRLEALGWPGWAQTGVSAVLRGSYHLYQGIGPFLGNALMGVVFAEWFRRKRRVMPLVVAHTILDVVAFVGLGATVARVEGQEVFRALAERFERLTLETDPLRWAPAAHLRSLKALEVSW